MSLLKKNKRDTVMYSIPFEVEALYVDWACMQGFTVILVYKWVDEEY